MPKKLHWLRSPTGSNGRCGWRIVISPKDSSGFSVLLRFFDAQSGRSFHPFHRRPGSVARSWRGPFPRCGVASAQAPDPDLESLPETISEFTRVGPGPRWLDGALGASNSSAPFRNRSEAFDTRSEERRVGKECRSWLSVWHAIEEC